MRASFAVVLLPALLYATGSLAAGEAVPCAPRDYQHGSAVCVCSATYCDTIPRVQRPQNGEALVITSSKAGLRFHTDTLPVQDGTGKKPGFFSSTQRLVIDRNTKFQQVIGFGGAFTDAVGDNLRNLSSAAQERFLRSYFSEDGLEYNIGRVPIGGCDFSSRKYSYQDGVDDLSLSQFALQKEDYDFKIPYLQRATAMLPSDRGNLLLIAATWSPPIWMKTSGKWDGIGYLKDQYLQSYANYHMKFLDAYQEHNLTFFALSTGNEPFNGVVPINRFNSLGWMPKKQGEWISKHMGPTLRNSKHSKVNILALDDQRYLLPLWTDWLIDDKASEYIDGIAVHWYTNFITPAFLLDGLHEKYTKQYIISTEASNGYLPWQFKKVLLGSWERGENYIGDIIEVMNHWSTGWVDWNLGLNMIGGPNWKHNYVDSPIIINAEKDEFYKQPTFYAIGHFSKFVPRESYRVKVTSQGGPKLLGGVENIAYLRPDGGVAVVLLNKHDSARTVEIAEEGVGHISMNIAPRSYTTVLYWADNTQT